MFGRRIALALGALALAGGLAACDDDSRVRDQTIPVPIPTPAPTAAPTPTPSAAPTAAPTPTPSVDAAEAELMALSESCALGVWVDCDTLYAEAPRGSDYRYWGGTCGGVEPAAIPGQCYVQDNGEPIPTFYVNQAEHDIMIDYCESGDMIACDLLWKSSHVGSPEEDVALSCGGTRSDPTLYRVCTASQGMAIGDSPYQDDAVSRCQAGSMTACDMLADWSNMDSEYYDIGYECGGHIPAGADIQRCEEIAVP